MGLGDGGGVENAPEATEELGVNIYGAFQGERKLVAMIPGGDAPLTFRKVRGVWQ